MKKVDELYDRLIETNLFTVSELDLIIKINGYSIDTLNDCIYARYGYRKIDDLVEYQV